MPDVRQTIREFILANRLVATSLRDFRDDTPLVTSGILDSLGTLTLIAHLEERFGVSLDVYDTSAERFDRLEQMALVVERKATLESAPPAARE